MQYGQVVRGVLVWEADDVGQLLNAGLTGVQDIEQSDPVRLGQDPEALCGEIDNVPRQWLAPASRSSRRWLFACFLHASLSRQSGSAGQLQKKLATLAGVVRQRGERPCLTTG